MKNEIRFSSFSFDEIRIHNRWDHSPTIQIKTKNATTCAIGVNYVYYVILRKYRMILCCSDLLKPKSIKIQKIWYRVTILIILGARKEDWPPRTCEAGKEGHLKRGINFVRWQVFLADHNCCCHIYRPDSFIKAGRPLFLAHFG